jgi:hypothetical protein
MAKSGDYLDPNRDLEQEEKYYLYLASKTIKPITLREWLKLKLTRRTNV